MADAVDARFEWIWNDVESYTRRLEAVSPVLGHDDLVLMIRSWRKMPITHRKPKQMIMTTPAKLLWISLIG